MKSKLRLVGFVSLFWFPVVGSAGELTFPALFQVKNVLADDVLNIRSKPNAADDNIIGSFAHDAKIIEVIRLSEIANWGLVNTNGVTGFVSLNFLQRQPTEGKTMADQIVSCHGTEPFWSLQKSGNKISLRFPDLDQIKFEDVRTKQSFNRTDRSVLFSEGIIATVAKQNCSNGMSDLSFGLSVDIFLKQNSYFFSGCCSLQTN